MTEIPTTDPDEEIRKSLRRDRYQAVGWGVFGLVFYLLTLDFDRPLPYYELGPAFWPQIVLIGIMIFAAVLFASTFLADPARERRAAEGRVGDSTLDDRVPLTPKLVAFFVVPLIWVVAMRWVGFPLTAPIFLMVFLWLVGIRRWWKLLLYATVFHGTLMLLFYKLIFTPLPQGAGWFYTLNGHITGLLQ